MCSGLTQLTRVKTMAVASSRTDRWASSARRRLPMLRLLRGLAPDRLEQRPPWSGQVEWPHRALGMTLPGVAANALHDAHGQGHGVPAFDSADARPAAGAHAVDKML